MDRQVQKKQGVTNQPGTIAWINTIVCLSQAFLCQPKPAEPTVFKGPIVDLEAS